MKNNHESQSLKLEEFKIVEFQNSLNGIRGGTGALCHILKVPTSRMEDPPADD